MTREILFLAHRVPYPPDRGDKIRSFHVLRHLAGKARVHLVTFADDQHDASHARHLVDLCASQSVVVRTKSRARAAAEAIATGRPISLTAFADTDLQHAVDTALARYPIDAIYVFSGQMAQYLPDRRVRTVMDFVDVDSAKFADYARSGNGLSHRMMAREERLMRAFEADVAARVDHSVFVSKAEAALFASRSGRHDAKVIENGIDTRLFDPGAALAAPRLADAPIVFSGQMDYPPNVEAVGWFARSVMPWVRSRHPHQRFVIVGRAPTPAVRALAKLPGIEVTGEVADVRGWLAAAGIVVAPLKIARGVQNKVLEAMAMARPVVASSAAAEGIDHAGTLRIATDAQGFADAVTELLDQPHRAAALGASARARMITRYGWRETLAPLDALMGLEASSARDAA